MSWTKGWKAFNEVEGRTDAGTCRGFLYEEGKEYEIKGSLKLCENGFHACKDAVLCYEYYPEAKLFAEVEFLGECDYEHPTCHKGCTSKIKIIKFHSRDTLISGHSNSGNYNSGHYNSGYRNSGNSNSGNYNLGYRNSGDSNSGHYNSGYSNTGNYNSGDYNSGSWNSCKGESGFFNTKAPLKIRVFNSECDSVLWEQAEKPNFIYFRMDPSLSYKENWQKAYSKSSDEDRELLFKLPNFNKDVFLELTGIDVTEDMKKC